MTEAAFPLLGAAFVVLVVLPGFALAARAALVLLERDGLGGPLQALNVRYLLLTLPSVLPLAWFMSAGMHQAESGQSVMACLLDHEEAALCFEPVFFALTLGLVMLVVGVPVLRRHSSSPSLAPSGASASLAARLERSLLAHPELRSLRGRIRISDDPDFALGTHGYLKPYVSIGIAFAARLSDAMLVSALGHESEHARAHDPLRYLVLKLALAMNPFGRLLLEPHAARWYAAREAHCDREAVLRGFLPLPLADAIVQAARPSAREAVALGARDTTILRFRVGMLLAFAERPPIRRGPGGLSAFPVALVCLLIALLLPHGTSTAALDALHIGAEHALHYFLG
jgi:hypothetical protein